MARAARHTAVRLQALFSTDRRSLAALRVGLGIAVLADTATRSVDLVPLYTDHGVLPRDLLAEMDGRGVYLSAHYWASAEPLLQAALFVFTALCAIALMAGWRTRLATMLCWYLVASVQIRQPLSYMGGDSILRLLLFWSLFLPMADRFSIDAARGRVAPQPDRFFSAATAALLIQVCLVYWATGLRKTGELWWSGQAIFYALHQERATAFGDWLRGHPDGLVPLTYATLALELAGPFLAFVPVFTPVFRMAAIGIFWTFHLGLAAAMNIGLFPLFSMIGWLAFVPGEFWERRGVADRRAAPGRPDWRSRLASGLAAIALIYVVVTVAARARVIPDVLPAGVVAVGRAARLQQTWNMFAPDPADVKTDFLVARTMADGATVTTAAARSFRWGVYLNRVGARGPANDPRVQSLRRFALAHCRDGGGGGRTHVERVAVVARQQRIAVMGIERPTTQTTMDVRCPAANEQSDQAAPGISN